MNPMRTAAIRLIDLVSGFIALMLTLRIILRVLQANSATPIVSWIYSVTSNFIAPFVGIFPDYSLGGGAVVDLSAILAMVIYMLLFFLISSVILSLTGFSAIRVERRQENLA